MSRINGDVMLWVLRTRKLGGLPFTCNHSADTYIQNHLRMQRHSATIHFWDWPDMQLEHISDDLVKVSDWRTVLILLDVLVAPTTLVLSTFVQFLCNFYSSIDSLNFSCQFICIPTSLLVIWPVSSYYFDLWIFYFLTADAHKRHFWCVLANKDAGC